MSDRDTRIQEIRDCLAKGILLPEVHPLVWEVIQDGVKHIGFLLAELDAAEANTRQQREQFEDAARTHEGTWKKLQAAEKRIAELEKLLALEGVYATKLQQQLRELLPPGLGGPPTENCKAPGASGPDPGECYCIHCSSFYESGHHVCSGTVKP